MNTQQFAKCFIELSSEVFTVPASMKVKQRKTYVMKPLQRGSIKPRITPSVTLPDLKYPLQSSKNPKFNSQNSLSFEKTLRTFVSPQTLKPKASKPKLLENLEVNLNQINNLEEIFLKSSIKGTTITYSQNQPSKLTNSTYVVSTTKKLLPSVKFKYDSAFLYTKIMRGQDFTPFQKLMSIAHESDISVFPYFTRVLKDLKSTEITFIRGLSLKPRAYQECSCISSNPKVYIREIPVEEEIPMLLDRVNLMIKCDQEAIYKKSYIFINFEGVVGCWNAEMLNLRTGALKFMRYIQEFFKIILITSDPTIAEIIPNISKLKGLMFSAVYLISPEHSKELVYLNTIYKDYNILNPTTSVLMISCLNIELTKSDSIFPNLHRITKKINIQTCPISTTNIPITFLIPNLLINAGSKSFEKLAASFKLSTFRHEFNFSDWLKDSRTCFRVIRSTLPFEILMQRMPLKSVSRFCRLHQSPGAYLEEIPFNYFVFNQSGT